MTRKIGDWFNHPNFWFVLTLYWICTTVQSVVVHDKLWYIVLMALNMLLSLYNLILRQK